MTFDENKIQQQFRKYQLEREKRLLAEAAARNEQEQKAAELQKRLKELQKALAPRAVTTSKVHKCAGCGKQIPSGSRVMVEGEMRRHSAMYSGGSTVASFRSLYYCNSCKATVEGQ